MTVLLIPVRRICAKKNKLSIATIDMWTDALLSMAGNIPPELSRATRVYGKAMEEAEKKGYSRFVQTAYAKPGTQIAVVIREKCVKAEVVKLPFV